MIDQLRWALGCVAGGYLDGAALGPRERASDIGAEDKVLGGSDREQPGSESRETRVKPKEKLDGTVFEDATRNLA
jgi:hypothetical protein